MIRFDKNDLSDLNLNLSREWLETNGLGGFACSSIVGANTRRYHGLLVAATKPPVGRQVLLSKLEETLTVDGKIVELSTNEYVGAIHPRGFECLREFRLDPFPRFVFEAGGVWLEKSFFMVQGENTVVVCYRIIKPHKAKSVTLVLRPLIAFRDYHALTRQNAAINQSVGLADGLAIVEPYDGLPVMYLAHNSKTVEEQGAWFLNFQYRAEQQRGLDCIEDLFAPCAFHFDLLAGDARLIASTIRRDAEETQSLYDSELGRQNRLTNQSFRDDVSPALARAGDQFVVARDHGKTVIAGYPWFGDWGRDTMVSLPGLLLSSPPDWGAARDILRTFARAVNQGMLPNRFPEPGALPEYNTVDATLWFFEAVRAYLASSRDTEFVREELYNVLADIVAWHIRGTRYGIRVDTDGLLQARADQVQLTWMDAKVGDRVITPRRGKPVEVQALWYNALCVMSDLAANFEDSHGQKQYSTMASLARWSFNQSFWDEEALCLYDVLDSPTTVDRALRPNQIFAVSLHYTMLSKVRAERVVEAVQNHLLTPFGLRTLAPSDPQYQGRYSGGVESRDAAYHQGTVWPWLIGPFISAYLRIHDSEQSSRQQAAEWLQPLEQFLLREGVGQLPEVFDGDAPHNPGGCFAQAWSVAELLRVRAEMQNTDARAAEHSRPF